MYAVLENVLVIHVEDCTINEHSASDPLKSGMALRSKHKLTQSQEILTLSKGTVIHIKSKRNQDVYLTRKCENT